MTKTVRARYPLEYEQEAVRMVERGWRQASVAKILGLVEKTLFHRVRANPQGQLEGVDSKPASADQMAIARLRAGMDRVKMERDTPDGSGP